MIGRIKAWLAAAGVALATVLGAFMLGRRQGATSEQDNLVRRRIDAMQNAKDARRDVETSDDKRLVDILTGRVRD